MKRRNSLVILALLMVTLVTMGCPVATITPEDPPPQGPYPAPPIQWTRTFGGTEWDEARSVRQTACGGFIIAGSTVSFGEGESDFWLVKTDAEGNKEWSRTFGGRYGERAYSVQQTACGGFVIAGRTRSFGAGGWDFWVVRTDAEGNKEWSRTFGGPYLDWASSVQQTVCGGFIIAGWTRSFGEGESDFWVVKTDAEGNKEWSRTFGGPKRDEAHSVKQTACGGFIIAGSTRSFGAGADDFWLIKTDPQGNKEWSQTFGGTDHDRATSVQQTACGGFIIAGSTRSFGAGADDFWLIKTDPQGNKEWGQTLGGSEADRAMSIRQTKDGGFIVVGTTARGFTTGLLMPGVPGWPGRYLICVWVVRTDAYGNIRWSHTIGTLGEPDAAYSVQQTACGGFIIAGATRSFGAGKHDFWLIKLAPEH